ncbi:MAG: hypothetical protein AAGF58_15735 [Pseudomonadota bacterium]
MAQPSSKTTFPLAAIKALVIIMALLIFLALGAIAAKLIMGSGTENRATSSASIIDMSEAGGSVVFLIEKASGIRVVQILDPETGSVREISVGPDGLGPVQADLSD